MFAKKKHEEIKNTPAEKIKSAETDSIPLADFAQKEASKLPSQRDIVFIQVCELIRQKKLTVKKNQPVMEILNNELLELLYLQISTDFSTGKATFKNTPANKEKLNDPIKLRIYVKGLCGNWLRRDVRLNGEQEFKIL